MKEKFNAKVYTKQRIFRPIKGQKYISAYLHWNPDKGEYAPPQRGKKYRARRWEINANGNKIRVDEFFDTLDDARNWQQNVSAKSNTSVARTDTEKSPLFSEVVENYRQNFMPGLGIATRDSYEKLFSKYFDPLMNVEMNKFTPATVDDWLNWLLKSSVGKKRRKYFRHELNLFMGVCTFYRDKADREFVSPVRPYHRTRALKKIWDAPLERDISPDEFQKFLTELRKREFGEILVAMAVVQYRHALRISEAQAICHQDFKVVSEGGYERSIVSIRRHVITIKGKGKVSVVETGTKNCKSNIRAKKHTTFPDSHAALMSVYKPNQKGYMFSKDGKNFIGYRDIQYAYTEAFKKAGLPYTATHVLKYGGGQEVTNEVEQATEIAMQVTGNSKPLACKYAVRPEKILSKLARRAWEEHRANNSNLSDAENEGKT